MKNERDKEREREREYERKGDAMCATSSIKDVKY
jgi:hypothetical protein